jgi:hypothetical protein
MCPAPTKESQTEQSTWEIYNTWYCFSIRNPTQSTGIPMLTLTMTKSSICGTYKSPYSTSTNTNRQHFPIWPHTLRSHLEKERCGGILSAYEIINRESLITVDLRSQSCLKVRPERRRKEAKRKLNRELTTLGYSPFFLTFSRGNTIPLSITLCGRLFTYQNPQKWRHRLDLSSRFSRVDGINSSLYYPRQLSRDFVWRIGKPSRQFSNHTRLVHTSSILYWEIYVWGGLIQVRRPIDA